ncbi:MAG: winged helix-turn-helix transcriptional regulator [Saprospiraceae bacterium]
MRKLASTNYENQQVLEQCPVTYTLGLIGGRWKPIILWNLTQETRRFGELKRQIPMITEKMLTQQLRELEKDGLIRRKVYPEVPPRVEYSLTKLGESLRPVLDSILQWGVNNMPVKPLEP